MLLFGLMGTAVSCVGFGFAGSFWVAMGWRFLGGVLNGNVGVMRTMVSEMIRGKRFQSRAFMILPMTANIGTILGPMIGKVLLFLLGLWEMGLLTAMFI